METRISQTKGILLLPRSHFTLFTYDCSHVYSNSIINFSGLRWFQ